MKIAVTYDKGNIFQHFGHTEQFKIYQVEGDKIIASSIVDTNGSGHGALANFLSNLDVNVVICGGIGGGAKMALSEAGIQIFGGVSGDADQAVRFLLNNSLAYDPNVKCTHHGEGHEEHCGSGGCGSHGCGHCGH